MLALSIRQPWAWATLHGGKDIENRRWRTEVRGRVLIHASKTMTKLDLYYFHASDAGRKCLPDLTDLFYGGIIGSVEIIDCVMQSKSPWFAGPYGFVLRNPVTLPFRPYKGHLKFFEAHLGFHGAAV
jgi:hypothetical protein